jgi:hypothetical protein
VQGFESKYTRKEYRNDDGEVQSVDFVEKMEEEDEVDFDFEKALQNFAIESGASPTGKLDETD